MGATPMPKLCLYPDAEEQTVTPDWPPDVELERIFDWCGFGELHKSGYQTCAMCSNRLRFCRYRSAVQYDDSRWVRVYFCGECGFWHSREHWDCVTTNVLLHTYNVGVVKSYSIDDKDVPLHALRSFLKRHPDNVAHTHPTAFEKLMADCLRDEYAPCEVVHIGSVGDRGIDIKLVTSDKEVFLIQVKRRTDISAKESVQAVRELNGVLFREGVPRGMVITTARAFTRAAQTEMQIKTFTRERYVMELRPFSDVVRMLNIRTMHSYQPWLDHIPSKPHDPVAYAEALADAGYVQPDD